MWARVGSKLLNATKSTALISVVIGAPKVGRSLVNMSYSCPKKLINDLITCNTVMIFSKDYCPWCKEAKKLFSKLGIAYESMELDREANEDCIADALYEMTGQDTVPNIFINGRHIGGYDRVEKLYKQGKLVDSCGNLMV